MQLTDGGDVVTSERALVTVSLAELEYVNRVAQTTSVYTGLYTHDE